jgi:hypothetical protein
MGQKQSISAPRNIKPLSMQNAFKTTVNANNLNSKCPTLTGEEIQLIKNKRKVGSLTNTRVRGAISEMNMARKQNEEIEKCLKRKLGASFEGINADPQKKEECETEIKTGLGSTTYGISGGKRTRRNNLKKVATRKQRKH